jgi:hypothetical protein
MYADAPTAQVIGIFTQACIRICIAANSLLGLEDT